MHGDGIISFSKIYSMLQVVWSHRFIQEWEIILSYFLISLEKK
jgi:hypothetical protein